MGQTVTAGDEIQGIPYPDEEPLIPVDPVVFQALKVHRAHGFRLIREGNFPIEVIQHGSKMYGRTADLRSYLRMPLTRSRT
jgi:hypothetical protein